MNKKMIKDFIEGESITTPLLVSNVLNGVTTNGSPYMSISFSDKTGLIEGKLWDVKEEQASIIIVGNVIAVSCDVIKYKNNLQVKVHSVSSIKSDQYDISDFVASSEIPQQVMRDAMASTLAMIENKVLKEIVSAVVDRFEHDFFLYPAASRIHHDFIGGLAEHVLGMIKLGMSIAEQYPLIDRDLLISGIIVHDMGKLFELSGTIATEYTTEGRLIGHISIMQAKLSMIAIELGYDDSEEVMLLRHMVLSHHGAYEYGSPVLPMIVEAEILSMIDNIDARMNTLSKALKDIKEGEFTPRLFALENRSFYKPVRK